MFARSQTGTKGTEIVFEILQQERRRVKSRSHRHLPTVVGNRDVLLTKTHLSPKCLFGFWWRNKTIPYGLTIGGVFGVGG